MCGISNIKLCHIIFQITLFTSLSLKKKYSNSTQFKFSFSFLKFHKVKFQKPETGNRLWSDLAIPRRLLVSLCPWAGRCVHSEAFYMDNQRRTTLGTPFFADQMNWKCPKGTFPIKLLFHKVQPLWSQETLFPVRQSPHISLAPPPPNTCPHEVPWLILVSFFKSLRNKSLCWSGSESFKLWAIGLAQESSLKIIC